MCRFLTYAGIAPQVGISGGENLSTIHTLHRSCTHIAQTGRLPLMVMSWYGAVTPLSRRSQGADTSSMPPIRSTFDFLHRAGWWRIANGLKDAIAQCIDDVKTKISLDTGPIFLIVFK